MCESILNQYVFLTLTGFRGEVSSDKRYSYLVRFYKTIVAQFLPSKETREKGSVSMYMHVCVCVCVCEREGGREGVCVCA